MMAPSFRIPRKRPVPLSGTLGALGSLPKGRHGGMTEAELDLGSAFADFVGAPHALPVAGARGGLWHILKWLESRHGSGEVVVPALTASIVPNVIYAAGFKVRFVDVDPMTFTADSEALLSVVGPETRAVVATHLEGFPVRTDQLVEALKGRDVWVIEDAAHAPGSIVGDRPVGSIGHAAIFSLGKGKHLNALDGGIVSTNEEAFFNALCATLSGMPAPSRGTVVKKIAMVSAMGLLTRRVFFDMTLWPGLQLYARRGKDPLYENFEDSLEPPGTEGPEAANRRLGPVQARLAISALGRFEAQLERRRDLHKSLRSAASEELRIQQEIDGTTPAPLEFVVRCRDRMEARRNLRSIGIDSQPTWMVSPHQLPAFRGDVDRDFPVAKELAEQLLYLPFYPGLHTGELARLADVLSHPSKTPGL